MKPLNLRLSTRITVGALALVTAGAFGLMFLEDARLRDSYIEQRRADLAEAGRIEELRLTQAMDTLRRDVLFLSNTPPVSGLIRVAHNNGRDPLYGNNHKVWVERLQQIFAAFSDAHPDYFRIRYIGVTGDRREIVRVEDHGNNIEATPSDRLPTMAERDYLTATLKLPHGQTQLSAFGCDRESGIAGLDCRLSVHAATPVFDEAGKLFGMLVINRDVRELLGSATQGVPPGVRVAVAGADGTYLLDTDTKQGNSSVAGRKDGIAADFPSLQAMFDSRSPSYLPLYQTNGKGERGYLAARRVVFSPDDPAGFLLLAYHIPAAVAAQQAAHIPTKHIVGGLLAMLLVGGIVLLVLRRTFAPLKQLTEAADNIADGNYAFTLPKNDRGEIGHLVRAIDAMLDRLLRREQEVLQLNVNLEEKVTQRTSELMTVNTRLEEEAVMRRQVEDMVQHENEFRRELIESLPGVFYMLDADGRLLMWNRNLREVLHAGDSDLAGACVLDSIGERDKAGVLDAIRRAFDTDGDVSLEAELATMNGVCIPYHLTGRSVERDGDKVLIGMGLDITERNKALAVLERHKLVLETALDGFWVTDERGFLEEVNEAYAGMSGYTAQELAGMHISQLEAQERPEDTKAHIETIISQGYDRFETRHRRKDGSVMDVEISTSFMPEHRKFFVFCRDITQRKLADLELRHNQELLIEAQRLGRLGSWELDLLSGELRWSDENYRIFEVDPVVKTLTYEMFLGTVHPDDRDKVDRAYSQSLLDRQPYDVVHRLLFAGGRIKWVHEHCDTVFDVSGKPLRSVGMTQDITEQKLNEEALRVAAITFETHDAIMITDAEANIIRVNRAFSEITGYLPEEVLGQNPRMMNSGRHDRAFYIEMWQQLTHIGTWSGEVWDRRKNGEVYPKWLTITAIRDERGETSRYVAIFSDITERKQAEEEIRNLAFYDPLTSLPNRRLFMERLRAALPASARHRDYGAVMFLDMDKFKLLNDTLGHHCGDLMLVEVAKRIKSCVREMDTVARLGGDEFTVLIEGMANDEQDASRKAGTVAEKIREALAHPYRLGEHEYHSTPSIGIALFQGNADTLDMLLKHADMAMYQAKGGGRNTVRFFDPVMQGNAERRDALESDLRLAVGRNELRLYYQVQVDNEQHPVGAEALLRWEHPGRGMMMPDQFIPVAEESALIVEIGNWVLDEACAQLARWHAAGQMGGLTLAVNVSPRQFARPDFVAQVADVIERYRIDPARLKLELTESVVSGDLVGSVDKIRALRSLGVSLSMDDFDTVYSSLYYLKQVASDQIKIHRDVVQGIASGGSDAQLVQAIVDLATDMHLDVYAEGVETEAQLDFLKQHGCMAYQGYLFGKPVPIGEFEELLGKLQE